MGDLMLDVVVAPAQGIERGTDVPGVVGFRQGGSAANTARDFARLGGRAHLVCAVGDDEWARPLVAALRADGVTVHPAKVAGPTGRLAALIERDGERSFVTQRGAADGLRAAHVAKVWPRQVDVLHVPGYSLLSVSLSGAVDRAVGLAAARGALVSADVSSLGPLEAYGVEAARERIGGACVEILFANREEAIALTGRRTARSLARLLDVAPLVVVKEGPAGCRVLWRSVQGSEPGKVGPPGQLEVATERLASSDTTGAGDAFAAGFLYALLTGGAASPDWTPIELRRAALAGHRAAAHLLRRPRPWLKVR